MEWFADLLSGLLPLYFIAFLGFIAGRLLKVDIKSITTLTIYIISPIVFVFAIAAIDFSLSALLAPILVLFIATALSFLLLNPSKLFLNDDKTPYITAMSLGTNNWGYMGIPIAFALFSPEVAGAYVLIGFSFQLYENTLGVYYISRGKMSPKQSALNILKLPSFYAIFVGLTLSFFGFENPQIGEKFVELFKGAYTVLGMMIIGLGLSTLKRFTFDLKFITVSMIIRFMVWPAVAVTLIALNQHFQVLDKLYHKPLILFSIMPMAANNIAFAAQFDMNPGKVSVAVLITTLFALIYIPAIIFFAGF